MKKLIGFAFVAFISACGGAPVEGDENTSTDPNVGETEQALTSGHCQLNSGLKETGYCVTGGSGCQMGRSSACVAGKAGTVTGVNYSCSGGIFWDAVTCSF